MLFCFRKSEPLYFKRELFRPDVNLLKEGGRIGFPVLATGVTSCLGYVVFAAMITGLGKVVFAAHSIAVTAEEIFYIPGYGLRSATQTLIGNSVGEQNHAKFRSVSRVSILLTLLMMCLNGPLLYLSAYPLMKLFTNADEVARIGASVLRLVAFSEPFFGLLIVIEGIFLRGRQNETAVLYRNDLHVDGADLNDLSVRECVPPGTDGGLVLYDCGQCDQGAGLFAQYAGDFPKTEMGLKFFEFDPIYGIGCKECRDAAWFPAFFYKPFINPLKWRGLWDIIYFV